MTDLQQFEEQIKLLNPEVINNTRVITADTEGDYLLHVSNSKFDRLVPIVSKRAAHSEDNTVTRIHTSDNLIGCLIGYGQHQWNLIDKQKQQKIESGSFLGGYYIHKVNFKVALEPNNKLVYDSNITREKWLITYNEQTVEYPATVIGKVIIDKSEIIGRDNNSSFVRNKFLLELKERTRFFDYPIGVRAIGITLDAGYYKFTLNELTNQPEEIKKIKQEEFEENKNLKASLLSFEEPAYLKW
jgi:hypothetical protein